VRELACSAMSGTPRIDPVNVLPDGSVFWKLGFANTWLKPPPESIQPTSACPGLFWQFTGGCAESTIRPFVAVAWVQRYVPPTPVTSGSEAGHSTVGTGIVDPRPASSCRSRCRRRRTSRAR